MTIGKFLLGTGLVLGLGACGALPEHASVRTELVSQLVFQGGAKGAIVMIDGAETGRLTGGKTQVPIKDGTHAVVVTVPGRVLYQGTVFITDGTQKIIPLSN